MDIYRKTPLMGWASWNCFRTDISEKRIKEQIDALISTGLSEHGYTYCNIDDGFFGGRGTDGRLKFHAKRFPNGIKVVANYAHSKGLKAGIYSDGGDMTCGFYYDHEGDNGINVGLYGYEEQDLNMYLDEFGFDFIKVDWCGGVRLGLDEKEQYTKIGKIVDEIRRRTDRQLVYNICRWQFPGAWAADVADSWRTGADITPCFESVLHQLDVIKPLRKYCSPAHVNDLDMMQIGNGLTHDEEKAHFAMWCMMSTPLMIGCDLTKTPAETLEVLKNDELIAINQDSACLQAYVVKEKRSDDGELLGEIWIKNLGCENSSCKAVAFLNRSLETIELSATLDELGLAGKVISARDLQERRDVTLGERIGASVASHGVTVLKIECEGSVPVRDINEPEGETALSEVRKVTLDEAMKLSEQGAYLVDVRERDEYEKSHLDGAVNIPYCDIHAIASQFIPDKDNGVILYCRTGKRSLQAQTSLECLGYKHIYFLGGIEL